MLRVLNRAYKNPCEQEENAVVPLAGGILQHGHQCGMLWGASLAAGARACQLYGTTPAAEAAAIAASGRLVETYRTQNTYINCIDITHLDKTSTAWQMISFFLIRGGTIGCFRMTTSYARAALEQIDEAFTDPPENVPEGPVSCAAEMARKMGATDEQATMAAGLAGGIGLCGGGCGALGAAVWMKSMQFMQEQKVANVWSDKTFQKAIDKLIQKFLKASDFDFECSHITGKAFKGVDDHAAHLQESSCNKIIDALLASD